MWPSSAPRAAQVLIGENLVIAAVGQASATLLFQGADGVPLVPRLGRVPHLFMVDNMGMLCDDLGMVIIDVYCSILG